MSLNELSYSRYTLKAELPNRVHHLLNWFAFFLGYPCLYILGNSVTLYIFLYIIYLLGYKMLKLYSSNAFPKKILIYFIVSGLAGLILAPWNDLRTLSLRPFQLYFQFLYWITIALFFIEYYSQLYWNKIIKYFLVGLFIQVVAFYLIKKLSLDIGIANIVIADFRSRNSLLFQMIGATPIFLYYLQKNKASLFIKLAGLLFVLTATLISGGRAGTIIIFLLSILFFARRYFFNPVAIFLITFFTIFSLQFGSYYEATFEKISYYIEPYNERLAQMMRGRGENISLLQDKSLLERQLHIEKGYEIINKYPFFGVGLSNYINYDSPIEQLTDARFLRLQGETADYYNRRSPHNSYIQVATELGLVGLVLFVILIVYPLWTLFIKKTASDWSKAVFLSMLGLSLHFYTIASAYGTITWFFIGLANAEAYRLNRK